MRLDDLDLTPAEWAEIYALRHGETCDAPVSDSALDKILRHRPEPVLEDGIYEEVDWAEGDRHVVYVRGGRFSTYLNHDGSLQVGSPLPDDTSGWTRLRVLADDEVAVRLPGYFVAPDGSGASVIWREREGRDPEAVVFYRFASPAWTVLFDALAAALPHRDES